MITSKKGGDEDNLTPDLTSLMDIIFIVMVFLLLTANIQVQTLEVAIPKAESTSELASTNDNVLAVTVPVADGIWGLQDEEFTDWESFTFAFEAALKQRPDRPVIIASDKKTSVEKLLKLFEFMQLHKIQATNIMMESTS